MDRVRNEELRALLTLRSAIGLKALGFCFDRGLAGGVCVSFQGRGLGAWWYQDACFHFSSMAYRKPNYTCKSLDQMVARTSELATASRRQRAIQ
ncbi:MAG: hypothetical protein AAFR75_07360 [Pseudomonadota bacterium]